MFVLQEMVALAAVGAITPMPTRATWPLPWSWDKPTHTLTWGTSSWTNCTRGTPGNRLINRHLHLGHGVAEVYGGLCGRAGPHGQAQPIVASGCGGEGQTG